MTSMTRTIAIIVTTMTLATTAAAELAEEPACRTCPIDQQSYAGQEYAEGLDLYQVGLTRESTDCDRIWLVTTRHLSYDACRADVDHPRLLVYRLDDCGSRQQISLQEFEHTLQPSRPLVIYVHGNRIDRKDAIPRAWTVYRSIRSCCSKGPVDWVIWSWPSAKEGCLVKDFREKADRCDTQGLYLAWFLRRQVDSAQSIALIGYSFGARVITGALHAMAGGALGRRSLSGPKTTGGAIYAGLIAPAIDATWMAPRGYHGHATKNLQQLTLMFSTRDAVLKRYWLIDRIRSTVALGYSGPQSFAPRADGSRLPVRSVDCAPFVGFRHVELDYYEKQNCRANSEMARVIDATRISPGI